MPAAYESKLSAALKDLGMDRSSIDTVLDYAHSGRIDAGRRILTEYRAKLLNDIHIQQDKLYRMDYIIRNFKGGALT